MKKIKSAENLNQLLTILKSLEKNDDTDLTSLPTYGGDAPIDTAGVWSWDVSRLLVGTCAADFKIISR